jgi:hypothetical protein
MKSSLANDFVLSLVGSAVFWATVAGIALRRLRIDLNDLNDWLKAKYQDIDAAKIEYRYWTGIAVQRTFAAIYGQVRETRFVVVVTAAAVVMNLFGVLVLHRDWQQKQDDIKEIQQESYKIEPQYSALMSTAGGAAEIAQAFARTTVGSGLDYTEVYLYDDPRSKEIRQIVNSYNDKLISYALNNHVLYEINLANLFGNGRGAGGYSIFWLGFVVIIIMIPSALIDATAASITISLVSVVCKHEMPIGKPVIVKGLILIMLLLMSIFHYSNIIIGNVWITCLILFILGWIFSVVVAIWMFKALEGFWTRLFMPLLYVVGPFFFLAWISNGGIVSNERIITQVLAYIAVMHKRVPCIAYYVNHNNSFYCVSCRVFGKSSRAWGNLRCCRCHW